MPNEVFYLGLSYGAIAVYGYLMHIENRKTFQSYASYSYLLCCEDRHTHPCWSSYKTIGTATKMSVNTVRKHISALLLTRDSSAQRTTSCSPGMVSNATAVVVNKKTPSVTACVPLCGLPTVKAEKQYLLTQGQPCQACVTGVWHPVFSATTKPSR